MVFRTNSFTPVESRVFLAKTPSKFPRRTHHATDPEQKKIGPVMRRCNSTYYFDEYSQSRILTPYVFDRFPSPRGRFCSVRTPEEPHRYTAVFTLLAPSSRIVTRVHAHGILYGIHNVIRIRYFGQYGGMWVEIN